MCNDKASRVHPYSNTCPYTQLPQTHKVEAFVAFLLHEKWAASHQKDKVNKYLRYAKIGAAALGGGALLAVTGGLAAPAISVGLAAMGTTAGAMVAR